MDQKQTISEHPIRALSEKEVVELFSSMATAVAMNFWRKDADAYEESLALTKKALADKFPTVVQNESFDACLGSMIQSFYEI